MVIRQGDVFWATVPEPFATPGRSRRPVVVVQCDEYNRSRLNSYVVAHLTSNLNRARLAGCVPLAKGEANLPRRSVVNVTQISTVQEHHLVEKIGTLSNERLGQVLAGVHLVLDGPHTS